MSTPNNAKPSIAMFCHDDPLAPVGSQETGGQAVYLNSLVRELDKMGWAVDVFTRRDSGHKKIISQMGKRSRLMRVKGGPVKYISRKQLFDFLPELYNNFLTFVNGQNPYALFHGHYWDGGWLALQAHRQFNKPLVQNFHSLGQVRYQTRAKYKIEFSDKDRFDQRYATEQAIIKEASAIISLSETEKQDLHQLYQARPEKLHVIPGGVNLKIFRPLDQKYARGKLNLKPESFILLFVGRLEWRKGVGTLISSVKLVKETIPNVKALVVAGKIYGRQKNIDDFKEYQRLLSHAKREGVEELVHFVGRVDHARLPLFYSAADIFVVPSYYEPFGLVTLEAMACKAPVIASRTGGLMTIIRDGQTGLLFEPRNPLDLRDKILQLYRSPDLRASLTEKAYQNIINNYSWKNIAQKLSDIYKTILLIT